MTRSNAQAEFDALLELIGAGVPDAEQYKRMSGLILDMPASRKLAAMDPFLPGYKDAAMELYLHLRGRSDQGYVPTRDEVCAGALPDNLWTELVPWSFRDAGMVAEHVFAWAHILTHLGLPAGGSLLEYGPGSGQVLLMAARMGYRACGVDIDAGALRTIEAQAAHLRLAVETECAVFGDGFAGQSFDAILFYEAFHHAFDFDELLVILRGRLKSGGRVVLCGEPIVREVCGAVPYAWGPRLDALSVFCTRRFGWMELGFTHDYFVSLAETKGWTVDFYPFAEAGRATVYVLEPANDSRRVRRLEANEAGSRQQAQMLREELAAMRASTSWRITRPVRALSRLLKRF